MHFMFWFTGTESNFNKYEANRITDYGVSYDYGSVMHYSAYAFSKNGLRTIVTKVILIPIFIKTTRRVWCNNQASPLLVENEILDSAYFKLN